MDNRSPPAQVEIPLAEHVSPGADETPGLAFSPPPRDINQSSLAADQPPPSKSLQPQPQLVPIPSNLTGTETGIETGTLELCSAQDSTPIMVALSQKCPIIQHYRRRLRSPPAPPQEKGNGLDHAQEAIRESGGQEVHELPASSALSPLGPRDLQTVAIAQAMEAALANGVHLTPP